MSKFSVLIPVYNGAEFISEALRSVEEQTLEDVQVVVSDNASTDETASILREWEDRLNLHIITQKRTLPMQEHFNAILDAAETQFYMLLCHDDYLADPNALQLAMDALESSPSASAVYCDLSYVNPQRRELVVRQFKRGNRFSADRAGVKTLRSARNQFGIPVGVRRASLGDLRYDPRFHYAMDVDLSWAISRGEDVLHIPKPLIANRYGDTNMTWSLLSNAKEEFLELAKKYDVPMGRTEHLRLSFMNFAVGLQKRIFGFYIALVSKWR